MRATGPPRTTTRFRAYRRKARTWRAQRAELRRKRAAVSAPARKLEHGRVGESVRRIDAIPKVTGEFAYASDLFAAGMLFGHTVRSPHAAASVKRIDTKEARGMPGVHAVLTHEDVPGEKRYGLEFADQPVLAMEDVRYFGEPVALVAAEHPEQARRAAAKIRRRLHPADSRSSIAERATEVLRELNIRHGDPDTPGDVTVEGRLRARHPGSGLPRPRVGPCRSRRKGRHRHLRRHPMAPRRPRPGRPCLGLEPEQVRIHLAGVGGAFGGREDLSHADPRRAARAQDEPPREDGLQPRGVLRRPRPPAPCQDLGGTPRRSGRKARQCPHADPPRRRRLRLQLDRRLLERRLLRVRSLRRARTRSSSATPSTRTTRPAGRCADSAPFRPASRPRRRWTSSRRPSSSTPSSCACVTPSRRVTRCQRASGSTARSPWPR